MVSISHWIVLTSHIMVLISHLIVPIERVPYPQKECGYCRMTWSCLPRLLGESIYKDFVGLDYYKFTIDSSIVKFIVGLGYSEENILLNNSKIFHYVTKPMCAFFYLLLSLLFLDCGDNYCGFIILFGSQCWLIWIKW